MEIEVAITTEPKYRYVPRNYIVSTPQIHKKFHTYVYRPVVGKNSMFIHFKFSTRYEERHADMSEIITRVGEYLQRVEPKKLNTSDLLAIIQLYSV